jgi:predicted GNAT family N-acyltransferase
LQALLQHAREEGHKDLLLHAQTHALAFYEKQGFIAEGEEFLEADMPHRLMRLTLD